MTDQSDLDALLQEDGYDLFLINVDDDNECFIEFKVYEVEGGLDD